MTVMGRDKAEITGHASGRKRESAINRTPRERERESGRYCPAMSF